jgi:nitrate/TMAO reductase-like tetraheme cytochrome c subunit
MKTIRLLSGIAAAVLVSGCASAPVQEQDTQMSADSGAELWSMTCAHCHNLRRAQEFTAMQWPVIVNHMRTHHDLTKSDAEAIAAYLVRLTE